MGGPVTFTESYYEKNNYVPKHITVDMGGADLGRVGENQSSRMVLTVEDEVGHQVQGFFTENEYISSSKTFTSRFRPTYTDPKNQAFSTVYDNLVSNNRIYGKNSVLSSMFSIMGYAKVPSRIEELKDFVNRVKGLPTARSPLSGRERTDKQAKMVSFLKTLQPEVAPPEKLDKMAQDPNLLPYLAELMNSAVTGGIMASTHTKLHHQTAGGNINQRNNAMYDYAELLNESDMIAKSSSMTVKQNGQTMHGTFMASAKGVSRMDLYAQAQKEGKKITLTGQGLKAVSKLQVLDYLCANFDRHYGNMFYQVDNSDPDNLRITGVQGIDNDASFGTLPYKGSGVNCYMSRVDDIKLIDANLAKEILALDSKKLEEKLHLANLSKAEIQAAHDRLSALQQKIRSNSIVQLSSDEEWQNEITGKTKLAPQALDPNTHSFTNATFPDPTIPHLAYDNGNACNIFQLAYEVCHNFNKVIRPRFAKDNLPKFNVGKAVNIEESGSLSNQCTELKNLQEHLKHLPYMDLVDMKNQLQLVTDTMEQDMKQIDAVKQTDKTLTASMLTDRQRNELSEQLNDLKALAQQYTESHKGDANSKDDKLLNCLHYAKSVGVHADFFRESLRSDAMEAEKNLASRMAEEIRQKKDMLKSVTGIAEDADTIDAEYADYGKRFSRVDKSLIRSSNEFKAMLKAYKDVAKSGDKAAAYQALSAAADKYLKFKVPEGKEVHLSAYARSRVGFARDLMAFADRAHLQEGYKAQSQANNSKQDAQNLIAFNNRCVNLVNEYQNALFTKDPEKIQQCTENILNGGKDFFNGYKNAIDISGKYSIDHPMQMALHDLMLSTSGKPSAIDAFANLHATLYNEKNGTTEQPYASANISPMPVHDCQERLKQAGQINYNKQQAAAKTVKQPEVKPAPQMNIPKK